MHLPLGLFGAVAAAIVGLWAWLGAAVPMPPSPLAADEKLYCVSYAPFRGAQNPLAAGTRITAEQIDEDLARLARVTDCVRTYASEHGLDQVAAIAARHGLKVMQGIWVSSSAAKTALEVESAVALANRYPETIRSVIVGNEVLLRGEMAATDLAALIRRVKAQVKVPVTYADVWEFWLRHRDIYGAVDFVTIHILPYWEDFPIAARNAAAHLDSIRGRVAQAFPDKEIIIGETGWPSAGRMREGALPSPANQALVLHETLAAGKRGNYRINVIEAFDQPWKRRLEGTVGGHWGILDGGTREPKFVWGKPVSNHPGWLPQAASGIALTALVFATAWFARRPGVRPSRRAWGEVAVLALVGGALVGWTGEKALLESLGAGGWLRSAALALVAIVAPVAAAAAIVRGRTTPALAQVLGGVPERPPDRLAFWLGLVFVGLCVVTIEVTLGLVFDPRYKDFPFSALTAAVVPFLLLAISHWQGRANGPARGAAEVVAATVLGVSVVYIALNESFVNWQAVWFVAALLGLVIVLLRPAGARN